MARYMPKYMPKYMPGTWLSVALASSHAIDSGPAAIDFRQKIQHHLQQCEALGNREDAHKKDSG